MTETTLSYCSVPQIPERIFSAAVTPGRARLIRVLADKWVNGTVLHYYFFNRETDGETVFFSDGTSEWRTWTTSEAEKSIVRRAFRTWKELGIGLEFEEVGEPEDAEIRIGFMRGDGAWSYLGRAILNIGSDKRTMNFGWDLTEGAGDIDTAIHEIGHTLGFPHEHQNPNAGIVWDEEAVYAALAEPPNNWDRDTTFHNIIRKIASDTVQGSNWDPNSIMHYPFRAGMIRAPEQYRNGISPEPGLSERDKTWVRTFYPPLSASDYAELRPLESKTLNIQPGGQSNFIIRPGATRNYEIGTFGSSDTVVVLFEDDSGSLRHLAGDDDGGDDRNARLSVKLLKGRTYVLRVRIYHQDRAGATAVMLW